MAGELRTHFLLRVVLLFALLVQSHGGVDRRIKRDLPEREHELSDSCEYVPRINSSETNAITPDEIEIEVEDQSTGAVLVYFPLRIEKAIKYSVKLFVNERAATPAECSNFETNDILLDSDRYYHSEQLFNNSTCKGVEENRQDCDSNCELVGRMTFKDVFAGCYIARVYSFVTEDMFTTSDSAPYLVKTDIQKNPVWKMRPAIGEQPNALSSDAKEIAVKIVVANFTILFQERILTYFFLQNGLRCDFYNSNLDMASGNVSLSDEGRFLWGKSLPDPFLQNAYVEDSNGIVNVYFDFLLKPGNYCFGLAPDHPVKCTDSAWTYENGTFRDCWTYRSFAVRKPVKDNPERPDGPGIGGLYVMFTAAVVVLLLLILLVRFIIIARAQAFKDTNMDPQQLLPDTPTGKGEIDPLFTFSKTKVLLLYAQDCEEFMTLMETFRELLQVEGNCDVMDCFDINCFDIEKCPNHWMSYYSSRSDVKVVLVASPCAKAHQVTRTENLVLTYKAPIKYSELFRVGLEQVMRSKTRRAHNTFVVQFDGTDLDYITTYSRYVLPKAVNLLFMDLKLQCDLGNLKNSFLLGKLETAYNALLVHHTNHPNYVAELLEKQAVA